MKQIVGEGAPTRAKLRRAAESVANPEAEQQRYAATAPRAAAMRD
jgi:hypothetical protein